MPTFDKNKPTSGTTWGNLYAILRDQFNALATHQAGASAPSSPDAGWVWFNTTTGLFQYYTGAGWASLSSALAEVLEIIAARGSKTTLDARLDVSLNEDGTLKAGVSGGNEWVDPALTPTYVSGTQFTVVGDQTDIYTVNRRVKATLSGGARYATVKTASYSAPDTTVTLHEITDTSGASATLDATLSLVEHAFVQAGHRGSDPRRPLLNAVAALANLPTTNLLDGDLCAVLSEDTVYQWDAADSAWTPVGRAGLFCFAQASPAMTVQVHKGVSMINGTLVEKTTSTTSGTVTAPTVNPRIDLLVMDYAGALSWVTGAESASPTPPTYPADKIPLCEIYLRVGTTGIYNTDQGSHGYIKRDVRPALFHQPRHSGISDLQVMEIIRVTAATATVKYKCRVNGVEKTFSGTVDISTTGALGRDDSAAERASTWYDIHAVAKEDGTLSALLRVAALDGVNTSASAGKLINTGALFVSYKVTVGDVVINQSTLATATVTAVDSETQLSLSSDIFTSSPKNYRVILSRAPTYPSGYIYDRVAGALYNDGSSNLLDTRQIDDELTYVGQQTILSAGSATTYTTVIPLSPPCAAYHKLKMVQSSNGDTWDFSLDGTTSHYSMSSTLAQVDALDLGAMPSHGVLQYKRSSGSSTCTITQRGAKLNI